MPSKLHHWGSSLKGTSGIQGGSKGSGIKTRAGDSFLPDRKAIDPFVNLPPTEPQSRQVGAISETPPTWLTPFAMPWRSPETPSHSTYGPTDTIHTLFLMNGWSWIMIHNFPNSLKQATADLSEPFLLSGPRHDNNSSQPRWTFGFTWKSPSPAQVAPISDCFIAQAGRGWPLPAPPGYSQSLHSQWTATDHVGALLPCPYIAIFHGGRRLVDSGHSQSLQLTGLGKSLHWPANSNQGSTTRGGCTQSTWRAHLKFPA